MKRKGQMTMGPLVKILLGIFIIAIFVFGVFPQARVWSKNLLAPIFLTDSEEEFIPYDPNIPENERIAIDSSKALHCASQLTVYISEEKDNAWKEKLLKSEITLCQPGFIDPLKKEEKKENEIGSAFQGLATDPPKCEGILYGQSCVECEGAEGEGDYKKVILDDKTAVKQIATAIINCYWKSEQINEEVNCARIFLNKLTIPLSHKEIENYILNEEEKEIANKINFKILDPIKDSKIPINIYTSSGTFKFNRIIVEAQRKTNEVLPAIAIALPILRDIYFYQTYNPDREQLVQDEIRKPQLCSVKNFELPQEISIYEEYIPGYGDPEFILFYERFPHGEEASWNFDFGLGAFASVITIHAGVAALDLIPAGKQFYSLFKKTDDLTELARLGTQFKQGKTLSNEEKASIMKLISRQGEKGLDEFMGKALYGKLDVFIDEALDPALGKKLFEEYSKVIRQLPSSTQTKLSADQITNLRTAFSNIDEFKSPPLSKVLEQESFYREMFEEGVSFRKYEEFLDVMRVNPTLVSVFEKNLPRGFISTLKRGNIRKLMTSILKKDSIVETKTFLKESSEAMTELSKKNPKAFENIAKRMDDEFNSIFNNGEYGKLVDGLQADDAIARTLNSLDTQTTESLQATFGHAGLGSRALSTLGPPTKTTLRSAYDFSKKTGLCATLLPTGLAAIPATALTIPLATPAAAGIAGKGFVNCIKAARQAIIPLSILAIFLAEMEDSKNQKYPVGETKNTLSLIKPKWYDTPSINYDLNKLEHHYLGLDKGKNDAPPRFFMVSPCKADIEVFERQCTCNLKNEDFIQEAEFQGNQFWQPIERPINLMEQKSLFTQYNLWDDLSIQEQGAYFRDDWSFSEFESFFIKKEEGLAHLNEEPILTDAIIRVLSRDKERFKEYVKIIAPTPEDFYILTKDLPDFVRNSNKVFKTITFISDIVGVTYDPVDVLANDFFLPVKTMDQQEYEKFINYISDFTIIRPPSAPFNFGKMQLQGTDLIADLYVTDPFPIIDSPPSRLQNYLKVFFIGKFLKEDYYLDKNARSITKSALTKYNSIQLFNTKFFDNLAKDASYKIHILPKDQKEITKTCSFEKVDLQDKKFGLDRFHTKTTIPCLITKPSNIEKYSDEGYNDNINYCFTKTDDSIIVAKTTLDGLTYAGALMSFVPGQTQLLGRIVSGVSYLGLGAVSAVSEHCVKWPNTGADLWACG